MKKYPDFLIPVIAACTAFLAAGLAIIGVTYLASSAMIGYNLGFNTAMTIKIATALKLSLTAKDIGIIGAITTAVATGIGYTGVKKIHNIIAEESGNNTPYFIVNPVLKKQTKEIITNYAKQFANISADKQESGPKEEPTTFLKALDYAVNKFMDLNKVRDIGLNSYARL